MALMKKLLGPTSQDIREFKGQSNRSQISGALMERLLDRGFTPEESNSVVERFVQTGDLQIPTIRPQELPPAPGVDVSTRSTPRPIDPRKKQTIIPQDANTGELGEPKTIPAGKIVQAGKKKEPQRFLNVVAADGSIKRVPIGPDDKVIQQTRGRGEKDPKKELAQNVMDQYLDAISATDKEGNLLPVPVELEDQVIEAAPVLGLTAPGELSFAQKLIKQIRQNPGVIGTAAQAFTDEPVGEDVRAGLKINFDDPKTLGKEEQPDVQDSKQLTVDQAKALLRRFKGDRKQAEEAAKELGFKF